MRYSLEDMAAFLAVMDLGTVTAAAARLNLSKSVVSKRVSDLETDLGLALFRRNAGRVTPTEAAHTLAEQLRPALAALHAATESVTAPAAHQTLRGQIAIAAPMSFGTMYLSRMLARFGARHPDLLLRIEYDDRARDLQREGFDLGVRIGHSPSGALISRTLCEDRAIPCAAPDLLDRIGRPKHPRDLEGQRVIGYSHLSNSDLWQFWYEGELIQPHVQEIASLNNGEAIRTLAEEGLGLAMLPAFIVEQAITAGRLEPILPQCQTRSLPISLVWPPVTPMPAKLRALIDHLVAETQNGPPWLR